MIDNCSTGLSQFDMVFAAFDSLGFHWRITFHEPEVPGQVYMYHGNSMQIMDKKDEPVKGLIGEARKLLENMGMFEVLQEERNKK